MTSTHFGCKSAEYLGEYTVTAYLLTDAVKPYTVIERWPRKIGQRHKWIPGLI